MSALLLALAAVPGPASADALTLQKILEHSLRNNGELQSFREEKGIADAGKTRAALLPNPTLEFEADTGALAGNGAENAVSVALSQEFLLGGKREKRLSVAQRELERYRWELADRERSLAFEVTAAFYDVIRAKGREGLAAHAIELNRQLLEVARERLAAGDIPELELNLVKVELARSEAARIEAADQTSRSLARLQTLAALSSASPLEIAGAFTDRLPQSRSLEDLKRLALERRPDLKALRAEQEKGDREIALAQADAVPNLTGALAVGRESSTMEIGGVEGRDTSYTVGIRLSMPLPVHDRNQAGVQEARARQAGAAARLASAQRAVEVEVAAAQAGLASAERVLALYRDGIMPQFEENLKLTQEAYRLGEVGILTVFEEQRKSFEVNEAYLAALHEREIALAKLETAVATELIGGVQ